MEKHWQEQLEVLISLSDETISRPIKGEQFVCAFASVVNRIYTDPDVCLNKVAFELGMSKRSVQRKLKDYLDMSFCEYVNEVRFYHARERLERGEQVTKVAYEIGFTSPAYFSTSFKKRHDQSPKSWQLKNRRSLSYVLRDFSRHRSIEMPLYTPRVAQSY